MATFKVLEKYPNYEIYKDGTIIRRRKRKVIKHSICGGGYELVSLRDEEGNIHKCYVHRIIYEAYNGEIPNGYEIDHIDGNRINNNLDNLRKVRTHQENCNNPISLERYKKANAFEKGKMNFEAMRKGKQTTDTAILGKYLLLSPNLEMGVYDFILKGKVGYPRAVRIIRMARGEGNEVEA